MDKLKEISSNLTHSFQVQERKNIALTGVVKYQGNLTIKGKINSVSYIEDNKKEQSMFSRLFK